MPACVVIAPVPNDACYNTVITADPFCCNTAWDVFCQNAYNSCVPPPPPVPGTINMTNGGSSTCTGVFYDSGGAGANYGNSQNFTYTVCSNVPGNQIILDFTAFNTESGFDVLTIYNGPTTGSPLVGSFTGTNSPGMVTSTGTCLTLVFTSDGSVISTGWAATISCQPPPPPPCGTPTTFNFTGGIQNFVVPPGVTSLTVITSGAQGGGPGGLGSTVTGNITVVPGQTLQVVVGGQGGCPAPGGFGGGGTGQNSSIATYESCGGGGASYIASPPGGMGNALIVASGGGGDAGGDDFGEGGNGGCGTGQAGTSPFGVGGSGATAGAGGAGGPPWTAGGGSGQNGSFGQGGAGGVDLNFGTAPGGGGGGGYYGGGGGGSDNIGSTTFIGGGGGGGGTSFVPAGGGCTQGVNAGNGSITIYVPTPNTMTSANTATICSGGTVNIPLTSTVPGSTFTWIATAQPNVTGESTVLQTTSTLNNTLTNTTGVTQTVTYTVTPSTPGCPGTAQTVTVNVVPAPTMTSPITATICSGQAVNIPLTATVPSNFTWVATANGNVTGESTAVQSTATINNTLTNTTTAAQTVVYTVTPTSNPGGCPGPAQTVNVTVNPNPAMVSPNTATICSGGTVNIALLSNIAGSTFSWIAAAQANVTGESTTAQSGSPLNNTLTNTTTTPQVVVYTVTPTFGTCTGNNQTVNVTVNPLPTIVAEPNLTFCAGDAAPLNGFVSVPVGATFAWTNSNTAIGLGASGTGSVPAFTATNATAAAITSTITITPTLATCVGPPITYTITINPSPTVIAEPNLSFCAGDAVPLNPFVSVPAGATFNWTNSNTAIGLGASGVGSVPAFTAANATAAAITSTITVTATIGACVGPPITYTITINPSPTVVTEPNLSFCAGNAVPVNAFVSIPAGATFAWTNSNTLIGLGANGTGSVPAFTVTNATAAAITSSISITPTIGTCVGPPIIYTITVNPSPTVVAEPNLTFCAGDAVPLNGFVSVPVGATFAWTNSNIAIGLGASGAGSVPAFTAANGTAAAITGTITVTPTIGTCVGPATTYTITVNPVPTVVAEPNLTFCVGAAVPLNSFVSVPAGATFTWTNSNTATGLVASGATSVPAFTATNATAAPIVSTVTITPTIGTCVGPTITYTITVNPNPIIVAVGVSPTACGGTNGTITITGLVASTGYSVSYTDDGVPVGPLALVSNGAGAITITGLNAGSYTNFIVTLGACSSTTPGPIVLVDPAAPTVTDPIDQTLCAGANTNAVNFTGTAGATFNWTNNTASIGLAASGIGNIAAFPAVNAGTTPVIATITVTPSLAGCVGTPQTFTITVNPSPTIVAEPNLTFCAGAAVPLNGFVSVPAGATFTWTNSNTAIGLGASGATSVPAFTATNATAAPIVSTVTITPTIGTCVGPPITYTITVNPNPIIIAVGVSPTACGGTNGTITITGLAASTGYSVSYTDDGTPVGPIALVSNGAGAVTITGLNAGSYTNFIVTLGACSSTTPGPIVLVDPAAPTVTDPADQTLCAGANTNAINFIGTAGATFNWTNNTASIGLAASGIGNIAAFPAVNAGTTPVIATITVTPSLAGCVGTPQTFTITVNPTPTVTDPANQTLCAGAMTTAVNFVGSVGATFNWTNSNTTIGLGASGSGNIASFAALNPTAGTTAVATITVTPVLAGCNGPVQTFTISVVNTLPTLNCPGNLTAVCSITEQPVYANFAAFTGAGGSASSVGGVIQPLTFTLVSQVSNGGTCPEIFTRTYSIQDDCGNTATCAQTITVDDNINPTGTAPAAISVQCVALVPAANIALITDEADNCAVPTVTFISDVSNGGTCPEIITRTYRITDACGNFIDVTQIITIDDTTNPTASNPTPFNGSAVPAANVAVVTDEADNCSVPVVAFVGDVTDGLTCPETITRTYSVTDACGNQILVTQTITIGDPFPPTASNPAAINVQCIALVPANNPLVVTDEADNNGMPVVAFVSDVSDGNTCPETITRTYSVTDDCGNQIFVTQTIVVDDTTNPTASNPAPVAVQCIALVPAANTAVVTDEADNCSVPTVAFVSDVSNGLTCPEIITRTYSVTDACGNQILVTQTITVDDTTNPTASAPASVTVQCIGDVPAADPTIISDEADNCSVPVVVFVSDVSNGLTCPQTITRTYSVTDACGNQILVTQIITVDDTTNPTASNPVAFNGSALPPVDITAVTDEADNCSAAIVAFVSDVTDGLNCPETITRTYSVTDACGNQIVVTQIITIGDPFPPTASSPATINVQCIALVPANNPLVIADEADNNGVPVVAFVSDVSDGNTCPETITRTYSVTDLCANQILVTQQIIVDDITNPTATNPIAVAVQCITDVPAFDVTVVPDEADNCTVAPSVAFVSDISNGLSCPETITRTYSVTDDCGNQILVTQAIIVDDTTNPTATNPTSVTVECIADVPAADPTVVIDEVDNCTVPVVAFVSDISDGNTCAEIITRTYSVTDACGNQILVTQTITIDDLTNPTASNPATIVVPGGPAPAPDPLVVSDEADNCTAAPIVVFVVDISDGNLCPETITRIYSVTDDCGNQILVDQVIQITDPIMPTASNPATINVECIADVPAPDVTVVNDEADNNGAPVVDFVGDISDGNTCPETITRTYSVTDACANQILVTQQIIVNDITNPTATNPIAIVVQCIADVPASNITVVSDEADNCTVAPVVAFVSDLSNGLTCPETITRTYSVTDDCGNQILVTQTIVVDDTTNPTASNPTSVTVECIGDVPASDPTVVIDEADNCTVPVVVFVSDVSNGLTCPETITRTYSVTDACGNQILVTQTIIVDDTTNPTASNPASVTVDIIANVPAPDPLVVTDELDNCSLPTVVFASDVSDGNNCPETITRTYSVTDACGNQITVTQTIIVSDIILPTASNPATVSVQCIANVPAPDLLAVIDEADNAGAPTVVFLSDVSDGNTCPETITRTYSVTDACANSITVTQTIIVDDTTNPTATNPVGVTVQCIGDVPASDITVVTDEADNCTVAPIVAFVSDISNGLSCPETVTRTYSVTDDCGNQSLVTQTIVVDDTTNPTASNPASVTVECIGDVPAANIAVVNDEADNCSVPTVAFVSDISDGNTCPETITRTYSVTDACGNQILVTQTIIVNDITNPTASNPAALNVTCASAVPAPNITVVTDESDNCTAAPTVSWVSDLSDGNVCNNETITRTYSITDNCGNSILVTQQIIIGVTTPTVSAGTDQAVCTGVQVTLNATNPNGAVITWDYGITNGAPFNSPIGTTTYTVTATQCGGECFATDQVDITVYPLPSVSFDGDSLVGCTPLPVNFHNLTSPAGANCTWSFGDGGTGFGCDSVFHIFETAGSFDITLTVTSNEGCTSSVTYYDYIHVYEPPVAEFLYSPGYVAVSNPIVTFENLSENADEYLWNFGDGTGSLQTNPEHAFPQVGNVTYTVILYATNFAGCVDSVIAPINIADELIFYVPNVFTPDGNAINNTFFPVFTAGYDIYDYHLTIFNRWGEVVFESYNATVGWDGTYGDQGLVEDGVYIWQIEFGETMSDKRHKTRGHVTILK